MADWKQGDRESKAPFEIGSFWRTVILLVILGLVLAISASLFGINLVQVVSSQLVGAVVLAIVAVFLLEKIRELGQRMNEVRKRGDEANDRLNERLIGFRDAAAQNITDTVRSQITKLNEEVEAIVKDNPWITSFPQGSLSARSTDLAVRFEEFFRLHNAGEAATALRLIYDVPRQARAARSEDGTADPLHATPSEIETVSSFALHGLGDTELARKIHSGYSQYQNEPVFLATSLRSMIASHAMREADLLVQSIVQLFLPRRVKTWAGRLLEIFVGREKPAEILIVDLETAATVLEWRLMLALAYYYRARNRDDMADAFRTAALDMKLESRKSEERILFAAEVELLSGRDESVIDLHGRTDLRIIRNRAKLLFLTALAARNVGRSDMMLALEARAKDLPLLDAQVTYYARAIKDLVAPLHAGESEKAEAAKQLS